MMLPYTVCLNFKEPIGGDYIESRIKRFLESLKNPADPQYPINGGVVAKTAQGDNLYFARDHAAFITAKPAYGALKAVRFALSTAKDMQDESSERLKFEFDPNSIYLEIGNSANVKKLKPICSIIQKRLYGGGNFAIVTGLVEYTIVLGTEEKIVQVSGRKEIVETEGTAKQRSLDELLDKLNNAKSQ